MSFGRIAIVVILALSGAGCVTARPVALVDGTHGWAIRCPHASRDLAACMDEASMICSGRYAMVTSRDSQLGDLLARADDGAMFVQGMRRTLVVSCQHDDDAGMIASGR
jgi:hypothetical protein